MSTASVRAHFEDRLARSSLEMFPFPHLVVTDALPAGLYSAVMADVPFGDDPGRPFGDPSWTRQLRFKHYYDYRYQHELNPGVRTLHREPWVTLGDAFSDAAWLGTTLRSRFPEYFDLRFGNIDAIEQASVEGGFWGRLHTHTFLQRHEPGYQLDAHTDIPSRIATCIFSFPPSSGYEAAGTQLLEPIDPRLRCSGNSHHPVEGFRVVATAPYAENTCLVFFKTRHSWHSVSPAVASVPGGRLGMQVQLYEPPEGAVIDLSAPNLVRNGQFVTPRVRDRLRRRLQRIGRR